MNTSLNIKLEDYGNEPNFGQLQKTIVSTKIHSFLKENELNSHSRRTITIINHTIKEALNKLVDSIENVEKIVSNNILSIMFDTKDLAATIRFSSRNQYKNIEIFLYYNASKTNRKELDQHMKNISNIFKDYLVEGIFCDVQWAFNTVQGIRYNYFSELIDETFYSKAYPFIPEVEKYIARYLDSKESLLFLKGLPGTGKTRFIRYMLKEFFEKFDYKPSVLYVSNKETLKSESIFIDFLEDDYKFLVLEDVDEALKSRKSGNDVMANILTSSDGLIANLNKKVIVTTNLPNIKDVDDALIRDGRCFDKIEFRRLTSNEANSLTNQIEPSANIKWKEGEEYSLASIFKNINEQLTLT